MAGIFAASLALRFWGLSRFNTLVFDEIYYARFASSFLKGELVFTGHPPLSTYIVAIGIWLGQYLPWSEEGAKNALAGLFLSPFSYRWLNAFVGSCIPLVVAGIAYQLSHRRSYALIAALLIAADGLFLVESRYALNNVYLIILGLLGHLCFLVALRRQSWQRWFWLGLAGVGFGASASIKWNGLGFLLGAYGVWIAAWLLQSLSWIRSKISHQAMRRSSLSPLYNLTQLHPGHIAICLALIPALVYYLSWIPYMQLDFGSNFVDLQQRTYEYHKRVGGLDAHPYCSLWYTWPLMLRPIAYFYETTHGQQEPVSVVGPPLPGNAGTVIYDVHAMGNPFLWWLSTAAVVLLIGLMIARGWQWVATTFSQDQASADHSQTATPGVYDWLVFYLLINWAANFLPWVRVTRCVFIYHYMESLVFAVMALALILDRWLASPFRDRRTIGVILIAVILLAFAFWMPLYLGLPLSPFELQIRRWLPSWI